MRRRQLIPLITVGAVVAVVAATAALSVVQLPVPPGRDQGIFLYHGRGLTTGMVPYRDMWDHKTPGIYAFYGAALSLFDDRYEAVNALDILWRIATTIALYALGKRLYGRREGLAAALIYGTWSATTGSTFWFTAQPEGLMVLPLVLAVHLSLAEGVASAIASGAFLAVAVALKPTALLFAPLLVSRSVKRSALVVAGGAAVAAAIGGWFGAHGALADLWRAAVAFNRHHAGVAQDIKWFFHHLWIYFALLVPPLAVACWHDRREPARRRSLLLLAGWLIAAVATVLVQRKYFAYHFFVIIAPLALLAARGLTAAFDFARARRRRGAAIVLAAALTAWTVAAATWLYRSHVRTHVRLYRTYDYLRQRLDRVEYLSRFQQVDVHLGHTWAVARYVGDRTGPDDAVLVWGFEPLVNYWAQRVAPTRFDFDLPLTFAPANPAAAALRASWRRTFIAELAARPPAYVVIAHRDQNELEAVDSAQQIVEFPELRSFLQSAYRRDALVGEFEVLRRVH